MKSSFFQKINQQWAGQNFRQNMFVVICLTVPLVIWLMVTFHPNQSPAGYGGADNILHYMIARYAPQHPELFFNHWGKPFFTILASPFAQLGIHGVNVLNIILVLFSYFLAYKISYFLNHTYSLLAISLTAFAPTMFFTATSSLTEPLFAFLCVLSVYLFLRERYILAAIIFSFALFVRTESIILYPLFVLAFLLRKQWKAIPFLFTGFVLISAAGTWYHKDFFWFYTKMPYSLNDSIYGSGELLHFVNNYKEVFGIPLFFLFVAGLAFLTIQLLQKKRFIDPVQLSHYILIAGIPVLFFAAHSWVWYKGTGGSLGLLRVMACIMPLSAVVGVHGFQTLMYPVKKFFPKLQLWLFVIVLFVPLLHIYFHYKTFLVKIDDYDIVLQQTAAYIRANEVEDNTIFYFDPTLAYYLNADIWSSKMHNVYEKELVTDLMKTGDFLVWDAHFGPNEGQTPLDKLMSKTDIELQMIVCSEDPNITYNGIRYCTYIFRKLSDDQTADNYQIASDTKGMLEKQFVFTDTLFSYMSDNNKPIEFLDNVTEFYSFIEGPAEQILQSRHESFFFFEAEFIQLSEEKPEAFIVFTVERDGKLFFYRSHPIPFSGNSDSEFQKMTFHIRVVHPNKQKCTLKSYVYNTTKKGSFLLKNIQIVRLEKKSGQ